MISVDINSVIPTDETGVWIVNITFSNSDGARQTVDYCLRDDDPFGLSPSLMKRIFGAEERQSPPA